ncbi:MAG: hypothetical protein IT535_14735 [Bauldia sp.]|nr:hypothetical protein [Bauldia sp.]
MNTTTIFAALASYIVIAILLLSVNVASQWRWWIKGTAVVAVFAFFGVSLLMMAGILGWPNPYGNPPVRFKLVWSTVVEPDRLTGGPGAVYLWVEEMDGNNVPSQNPRSFQLAYTDDLAAEVRAAQQRREDGEQIMGEMHMDVFEDPFGGERLGDPEMVASQESEPEEPRLTITFQELPPIITSGPAV